MRTIRREEAFLVFDKFRSENARVYCQATCIGWYTSVIGKITRLTEIQIDFKSEDGNATFGLRLDMDDTTFHYMEPRELPVELRRSVPEGDQNRSVIGIGLPLRFPAVSQSGKGTPPTRENIFIHELAPGSA